MIYFGDHIYTDLAGPMLELGWHTAAIVPELAREIRTQNTDAFRWQVRAEGEGRLGRVGQVLKDFDWP